MKLLPRVLLVCAACCAASVPAAAQGGASGIGTRPWSFSASVNGSYEGNALFVGPEGDQEFAHQVSASLGRTWTFRRGGGQLFGNVNQAFYQKSASLEDFRYNIGGGFTHAVTRRLTWSGTSAVASGLARDQEVLTDAGLVLPTATARTSNSTSTLNYLLTQRSNLSWAVNQQGVGFSSAAPFIGGTAVGSTLNWSHLVGRAQSLGVTQGYQRTFAEDNQSTIMNFLGTWSMGSPRGWTIAASGGVSPYSTPSVPGYQVTMAANANLTKPVRPGQTVGVGYSRGIEQSFGTGLGNRIVQTVSGNYGLLFTRKMNANFNGSYSRGSSTLTPDRLEVGATGTATLTYAVLPNLNISVGSSVYQRSAEAGADATSYRTFMALTYNAAWR